MVMTVSPGEPYFAYAMKVCGDLDFEAIAVISLDVRLGPDDLAAAGVREADLVIEPLMRRAAELGHSEAQFNLGALHAGGVFVDYDDREALRWYRKAAEQGHAEAAYQVVKYLRLDPPEHRMTHAPSLTDDDYGSLLATAAAGGRTDAVYLRGALLYDERTWKRGALFECRPGFLLIEQAAHLAHRPAMAKLAAIHVEEGFAELGALWFRAAAQAAYLDDAVEEAIKFSDRSVQLDDSVVDDDETALASTLRVPVDRIDWGKFLESRGGAELAFRMASCVAEEADWEGGAEGWLRIAADLGHAPAAFRLGNLLDGYWSGQGDLATGIEAAERFAQAARVGVPGAAEEARETALILAEHFAAEGDPEADEQADIWFGRGDALGCPEARYLLACRLASPSSKHDPVRAFSLFSEAAQDDFPDAHWEVAERLRQGIGVHPDPVRALEFYTRAADHGFLEAQLHLGRTYRDGIGVAPDLGQALTWLGMAAEDGNADAQSSNTGHNKQIE